MQRDDISLKQMDQLDEIVAAHDQRVFEAGRNNTFEAVTERVAQCSGTVFLGQAVLKPEMLSSWRVVSNAQPRSENPGDVGRIFVLEDARGNSGEFLVENVDGNPVATQLLEMLRFDF